MAIYGFLARGGREICLRRKAKENDLEIHFGENRRKIKADCIHSKTFTIRLRCRKSRSECELGRNVAVCAPVERAETGGCLQ